MPDNNFAQVTEAARPFVATESSVGPVTVGFTGAEWLAGPKHDALFAKDLDEDFYLAIVLAVGIYAEGDLIFTISRNSTHQGLFNLRMSSANRLAVGYRNQSASLSVVNFSAAPDFGGKLALAEVIKDGAAITCYLDGVQVAAVANARPLIFSSIENDSGASLGLGARGDGLNPAAVRVAEVVLSKTIPSAEVRSGILAGDRQAVGNLDPIVWLRSGGVVLDGAGRVERWNDTSGIVETAPKWPGSLRVAQAQFDENWLPAVLDHAEAAGLGLEAIRFNFLRPHTPNGTAAEFDARYKTALDVMQAKGLKHYLGLFDGGTPYAKDPAVFAAWAVNALTYHTSQYPGVCVAAEIWNEPDGSWPISAADYLALARAVHQAVRANPAFDHILLAGAATSFDMEYWDALIAGGFLDLVDVASHHIYDAPEQIAVKIQQLREKFVAAGKADMPIVISEYGGESDPGKVARDLTMLKTAGVMAASYFILRDYGGFPSAGLLTAFGALKATGAAWNEWHARIGQDATFLARDELSSAVHSYKFGHGANVENNRIMWAVANTNVLINGAQTTLTTTPIYVDGDVTVELAPGDVLLADVTADFTLAAQYTPFVYLARPITGGADIEMKPNVAANRWELPDSYCTLASVQSHPSVEAKAVRRFVVPTGVSRIKITGGVRRSQTGGDGTDVWILHGVTERFRRLALDRLATSTPILQVFDVLPGEVIDMAVGPNTTADFDAVAWNNVLIYSTTDAVTEPDLGAAPPPPPPVTGTAVKLIFGADGIVRWEAAS